ncbi:MAG: hypothetical protein PVF22_02955 [Candidatus Aminicenantes bacterium]|jgi:hypothetical protein
MRKTVSGVLSVLSLLTCLAVSVLSLLGKISGQGFRTVFLLASLGWFVFASLWNLSRRTDRKGKKASG